MSSEPVRKAVTLGAEYCTEMNTARPMDTDRRVEGTGAAHHEYALIFERSKKLGEPCSCEQFTNTCIGPLGIQTGFEAVYSYTMSVQQYSATDRLLYSCTFHFIYCVRVVVAAVVELA